MPRRSKNATKKQAAAIMRIEQQILSRVGSTKKKKQSSPKLQRAVRQPRSDGLSRAGNLYLHALTDPFNPGVRGATIPDSNAKPSVKLALQSRFTISVSAGNCLVILPCAYVSNDGPAAFYGQNTLLTQIGAVAVNKATWGGCPFSTADLNTYNAQYRMVSYGLKIRYMGTKLNQGGYALFLEDTSGQGLLSSNSLTTSTTVVNVVSSYSNASNARMLNLCDRDEHEAVWHPHLVTDAGNAGSATPATRANGSWFSTATNTIQASAATDTDTIITLNANNIQEPTCGLFLIAPADCVYAVELIAHAEYHAGPLAPLHTPSATHVMDQAKVANAIHHAKISHAKTPHAPLKALAQQAMDTVESTVAHIGGKVLERGAMKVMGAAEKQLAKYGLGEAAETALMLI